MNRAWLAGCVLLGATCIAGCATRTPPDLALYGEPGERGPVDASALAGRRIVLDPGHGGPFNGALGVDSLREADVNLGVALYLWGLLRDAGASVEITRTSDRSDLPPGSEPRDDLQGRMERANAFEPELFISIHHNSNIALDRSRNGIEVYYRSDDPECSLELAREIQIHLARNLGIPSAEIKPGNYFVLRQSTALAAVLGEASYISHPRVEERLKLADKQRLEAEAYFRGIVSYFERGVPTLARRLPARDTIASPADIVFSVATSAGAPLDPGSARVTVSAAAVPSVYDPAAGTLAASIDPRAPNGLYRIEAAIRSVRGATGRIRPFTILLARPARHIVALPAVLLSAATVRLSVTVLDELGSPVADGTPVTAAAMRAAPSFSGRSERGRWSFETSASTARGSFVIRSPGATDTLRFPLPQEPPPTLLTVVDASTGAACPSPTALTARGDGFSGGEDGTISVPPERAAPPLLVLAPGYRPALVDSSALRAGGSVALEPLFGGIFRGRRIVIDPAGGGSEGDGLGPGKLRGASVNLEAARGLAALLERCGAKAILTRRGEETLSPLERVYLANRAEAALAISISHGGASEVRHYPGSAAGERLARSLADAISIIPPFTRPPAVESAEPFLSQTSCPACAIAVGPIGDGERELLFADPAWLRLEAATLLAGLRRALAPDSTAADTVSAGPITVRIMKAGSPAAGALVEIDRLFTAVTDAAGAAFFPFIESGDHLVVIEAGLSRAAEMRSLPPGASREIVVEVR